jgi:glycosyltransferase involved in cell wall biosynthesis
LGKVEAMTALFIHGITEIGGAERDLLAMLDRLPRRGFHPLVVCPGTGPLTKELVRRGVEVRFASMPAWQKLFAYPQRAAAVLALRMIITEVRPMLLHVNDIWWVPQTLRAAARAQIPIVAHVRQEIEPRKARRYELDEVDLVLPVSCQIQQSLEKGGVLPERLQILYSGVDLSRVLVQDDGREVRRRFGIPADALVLGTVANPFARKGYGVMLRALPAILASFTNVHYLIVGSGDVAYEARLRAMVMDLRLEGRVHFAGFQVSVYPYLAAMDVYVHPALMEGFGIAVLEAMAMRKPVVATTTGGLPEIVQDGTTGVLVAPNEPDALARAIVGLLQDSTRRVSMGREGRNRVETLFTVEAMMDRLIAAYGVLLGKETPFPSSVSV